MAVKTMKNTASAHRTQLQPRRTQLQPRAHESPLARTKKFQGSTDVKKLLPLHAWRHQQAMYVCCRNRNNKVFGEKYICFMIKVNLQYYLYLGHLSVTKKPFISVSIYLHSVSLDFG